MEGGAGGIGALPPLPFLSPFSPRMDLSPSFSLFFLKCSPRVVGIERGYNFPWTSLLSPPLFLFVVEDFFLFSFFPPSPLWMRWRKYYRIPLDEARGAPSSLLLFSSSVGWSLPLPFATARRDSKEMAKVFFFLFPLFLFFSFPFSLFPPPSRAYCRNIEHLIEHGKSFALDCRACLFSLSPPLPPFLLV